MSRVYTQRKVEYFERLKGLFAKYDKCFVVSADFVGSNQMQMIRMALRGTGVVVFGKNTMMRAVLKQYNEENPGDQISKLLDTLKGNVGLVFTDNADLVHVRNILVENVVPAPAKAGVFAPVAVTVPAGPTGMEPGMTSFFQALNIATQIKRGAIEIINDVPLLQVGDKVEPGHAALLQKLNIMPFSYGLEVQWVYDNGALFDPKVLDLDDAALTNKFMAAVNVISALSLEIGIPTLPSIVHSVSNAFQKLAMIALEVGVESATITKALEEAGTGGGGGGGAAAGGDGAAAAEEEKEEEEEEEEVDMGGAGGLFGDEEGGGGDY